MDETEGISLYISPKDVLKNSEARPALSYTTYLPLNAEGDTGLMNCQ